MKEEVSERGVFTLPACDYDPEKGYGTPYLQYTYGAVGVELEVNTETGAVTVNRLVARLRRWKGNKPQIRDFANRGELLRALVMVSPKKW